MPLALEPITLNPQRFFGPITAFVTIEERGTDRVTITRHPVEQGAEITDHAYVEPAELQLRFGATNSSQDAGGDESYVTNLYTQVLALKDARETIQVQTGQRLYDDMVIESIEKTTDERTEAALMLVVILRQIIIVETQVTSNNQSKDPSALADAQKNLAPVNNGAKQSTPTTQTVPQGASAGKGGA